MKRRLERLLQRLADVAKLAHQLRAHLIHRDLQRRGILDIPNKGLNRRQELLLQRIQTDLGCYAHWTSGIHGTICDIPLPENLKQAEKLEQPIFTPSTKAEVGEHDINVNFDTIVNLAGTEIAQTVREISLNIYKEATEYASERGIIIADTKFEFGLGDNEEVFLIDEVLTPDSSRFWPKDSYKLGESPKSFDKQYVRDYLETLEWNKKAPGPKLPQEVINNTSKKYLEACLRLTGKAL